MEKNISKEEITAILYTDKKLNSLKRRKIISAWKKQRFISSQFQIFRLNHIELQKALSQFRHNYDDPFFKSEAFRHRHQNILSQKYLNFIASGQSFLEINKRLDFDNSLFCFFKELRNFSLHHNLLQISTIWFKNERDFQRVESFTKDDFFEYLKSRNQNNKKGIRNAISFLEDQGSRPDLESLCNKYFNALETINEKILIEFIKTNLLEINLIIKDVVEINDEIKNIAPRVIGLIPPLSKVEIRFLNHMINKFT